MIYLDHNATTPIAPEVREAMLPYLTDEWGNASSNDRRGCGWTVCWGEHGQRADTKPARREFAARMEGRRAAELKRLGWIASALAGRRKGDPQKVELARRLREETTMTLPWLVETLNMGAAGSLANLLRKSP